MTSTIRGVRIAGVASAVPSDVVTAVETGRGMGMTEKESLRSTKMTGVARRHVAPPGMCTTDMAYHAAAKLLDEQGWDRAGVQALVMVTQTPDYFLPATASPLHARLGLSSNCAAFDVTLGCSGYIYGLWLCGSLIASGAIERALLLTGETASWLCAPQDRSTMFLFGDAGTATTLERDPAAPPMHFVIGSDGAGSGALMIPGGAYRQCVTPGILERRAEADGALRNPLDLHMDGAEVFKFTLERVPAMMEELLAASGWTLDSMDAFVPHQANLYMLQVLSQQMKIPAEKLILSLDEYGNTSSASIPLALNHRLAGRLRAEAASLVMAGFGVGWSWAAVAAKLGPLLMPEIVVLETAAAAKA